MRLVRRLRGSHNVEVAPPRGSLTEAADHIQPLSNIDVAPYCKLFAATKQQVKISPLTSEYSSLKFLNKY